MIVVRLTLPLLSRGELAIARAAGPKRTDLRRVRRALACSAAERRFARELLRRRTNLWLFRPSQQAFAGDFVVVDVSPPRPDDRVAIVLELKQNLPIRYCSEDMHQVRNARIAVASVARSTSAILEDAPLRVVCGDPGQVLSRASARDRAYRA